MVRKSTLAVTILCGLIASPLSGVAYAGDGNDKTSSPHSTKLTREEILEKYGVLEEYDLGDTQSDFQEEVKPPVRETKRLAGKKPEYATNVFEEQKSNLGRLKKMSHVVSFL